MCYLLPDKRDESLKGFSDCIIRFLMFSGGTERINWEQMG